MNRRRVFACNPLKIRREFFILLIKRINLINRLACETILEHCWISDSKMKKNYDNDGSKKRHAARR